MDKNILAAVADVLKYERATTEQKLKSLEAKFLVDNKSSCDELRDGLSEVSSAVASLAEHVDTAGWSVSKDVDAAVADVNSTIVLLSESVADLESRTAQLQDEIKKA